ncbi:MAG: Lrp/AsnC family transcriptional regulator [Nanoarchaeota archaeon]
MDIKDRKLLYLLDLNSRAKESELAKQLKTSKQVVNYRIKKLEQEGIIKKFQTVLNFSSLGVNIYANVYFKLTDLNKKNEKELMDFLLDNPEVGYIGLMGGRYDLSIVLTAKNLQELDKSLSNIVKRFPNYLRDYNVSLRLAGYKFHKKYLIDSKMKEEKKIMHNEFSSIKLDTIDKEILLRLTDSSRTSLVDISEKIKIPFSTVRTRVKNLESNGIISGYSLLFDLNKVGMSNYKLFINVKDKSEEIYNKLFTFAESHKNIIWFFKTLGEHDYEFRIEAESQEKYQEIIKEIRSEFVDALEETETLIVFKELKEDYGAILNKK